MLVSSLLGAMHGYDVINLCSAHAGGAFALAGKLGLFRTVVSVHGLGRAAAAPPSDTLTARFADAVTVVSRRLERHFRDAYGRDTFYIPNGIVRRAVPPPADPVTRFGLVPDHYVLLAGRAVPEEDLHLAVQAANACGPLCRMVVAETGDGDAEYRARLRRDADPGRVMFLGRQGPAALDVLIAHAYLVLVPASAGDEPPPTLIQALAHGRAVLVGDQPEHLDVVGGDGFAFTAGDAGDLRRVLMWLLHDREVVGRMRCRTLATVGSQYCWDRIAEAYEMVFTSVL
jgi:glycosyltransferase involved in cell wall biosynthesis